MIIPWEKRVPIEGRCRGSAEGSARRVSPKVRVCAVGARSVKDWPSGSRDIRSYFAKY